MEVKFDILPYVKLCPRADKIGKYIDCDFLRRVWNDQEDGNKYQLR